jgi:hypothetical protein
MAYKEQEQGDDERDQNEKNYRFHLSHFSFRAPAKETNCLYHYNAMSGVAQ